MNRRRLRILVLLCFLTFLFCAYSIYRIETGANSGAVDAIGDMPSTKEWQDSLYVYLNNRNSIINDTLSGRYSNDRKYTALLKKIECSPLLDGDIALLDYMCKNPNQFTDRKNNINIEYSDIRQLTNNEVVLTAKVCFSENGGVKRYDYEAGFKKVKDKWYLSKFTYCE